MVTHPGPNSQQENDLKNLNDDDLTQPKTKKQGATQETQKAEESHAAEEKKPAATTATPTKKPYIAPHTGEYSIKILFKK